MGGTRPTIRPIVFALAQVGVISQYIKTRTLRYITQVSSSKYSMSQLPVVNVGGEECKLVTIGELCDSYKTQSKPEWLSDANPKKRARTEDTTSDAGEDTLPEQANDGTVETTDILGATESSDDSEDQVVHAGDALKWNGCECTKCLLKAFIDNHKNLSPIEKVALYTRSTDLTCNEDVYTPAAERYYWQFSGSKHMHNTNTVIECMNAVAAVSNCEYRDKWPRHGIVGGAVYPMDDGRFCGYRKHMPFVGNYPIFDIAPMETLVCSNDLFFWKRSPWIRQIGSLMVCTEHLPNSEGVLTYNVHHSKLATILITRAMNSKHCMQLQKYMQHNVPYMLEFGQFTVPTPDYDEMMLSRACGMLAYSHFCGICDGFDWSNVHMTYIPSLTANALPRDSLFEFADLDMEDCYEVVQSGVWDVMPIEIMKREMYAMLYKFVAEDEHPETLCNVFKSVNIDDDYDDGYMLAAELPLDGWKDKCKSHRSGTSDEKVGEYLLDNEIYMKNFWHMCREWRISLIFAFAKNMECTRLQEHATAEEVHDYCLSLMVSWQTSVYGLIACHACRIPISHKHAQLHWLCGCRVYDMLAWALQDYVDSLTESEEENREYYLEDTDKEDYYKFMQRWMDVKMADVN